MTELAPYAVSESNSRGRRQADTSAVHRSEFQRDRDRIVHCTAFRRLEYKTQVFVNHEGDLFRTRLTHSIEVAQIARSIARRLALDEDLVEAISLAHDLGHTPFGHAGQDALSACMAPWGGFEHNLQSLRVVDELEQRYGAFDGLNLCFETREGILKHCSPANARALGELGRRFIEHRQPSLEAQLANLADEIAYDHHDVDDGLRSGLLSLDELETVDLFADHARVVRARFADLAPRRLVHEVLRRMISERIEDLLAQTRAGLAAVAPIDIDAVRLAPPLAAFSDVGDVTAPASGSCGDKACEPVPYPKALDLSKLHLAVGGGIRYRTVIGTIRFDLGVRLNRLEVTEADGTENPDPGSRIAYHFSIGEAF
jgi:dGTPase